MRLMIAFILLSGCAAERELTREDPMLVTGAAITIIAALSGLSK